MEDVKEGIRSLLFGASLTRRSEQNIKNWCCTLLAEVNVIMRGNQDCGLEMCTDCHPHVLVD